MLFKKRTDKNQEIDEIEKLIEPEIEAEEYSSFREPVVIEPNKESAPLFVKVDKYKETLINLQEIRILINGIKNVFSLFTEIETVKNDALKLLRVTLQRIEKNVIELDSGLLRPHDVSIKVDKESEVKHIEDSLSQLHEQISTLKTEIEKMGTKTE